jgi:hypothetical protein
MASECRICGRRARQGESLCITHDLLAQLYAIGSRIGRQMCFPSTYWEDVAEQQVRQLFHDRYKIEPEPELIEMIREAVGAAMPGKNEQPL